MLLLDDGAGGVVSVAVRLRDRIKAAAHADRIDVELARGVSPESTVERALRARRLTGAGTRRSLAKGVERVLTEAERPALGWARPRPIKSASVMDAYSDLTELRRRLLAGGPISVRGAAQAQVLLTDGNGPLYRRRRGEDLTSVARATVEALYDFDTAPSSA